MTGVHRPLGNRLGVLATGCPTSGRFCQKGGIFRSEEIPPDRRLILRSSTSAKVAHIFARLEHYSRRGFSRLGHLAIDRLEVCLDPTHTGDFNLSILRDPE